MVYFLDPSSFCTLKAGKSNFQTLIMIYSAQTVFLMN